MNHKITHHQNHGSLSDEYSLANKSPLVTDYLELRKQIGWDDLELKMAKQSLRNSLYHVTIHQAGSLVAMGRVIGDGAIYFYIQDVMVAKDHQNRGLGDAIMRQIENFLARNARKGSTIGLLASKGKESFYSRFGYQPRTGDNLGLGMCKFV